MHITRRRGGMLVVAGLLALALAGATGIAVAQSSNGNDKAPAREHDDADPGKTSSVTVPAAQAATEADEGTALQGLAKITQDQAKAAAVAAVPGDATKVELENEEGGVVYKVEVAGANGTRTDLVIDAGNGAVLSRETETEDTRSVDEAPDSRGGSDEAGEAKDKPETNDQHRADEAGEAPEAPGD
jgi:uncharacterized membrane protein YkoI